MYVMQELVFIDFHHLFEAFLNITNLKFWTDKLSKFYFVANQKDYTKSKVWTSIWILFFITKLSYILYLEWILAPHIPLNIGDKAQMDIGPTDANCPIASSR